VKYEMGFHIPEDDILHSHRRENLKSYIALTGWAQRRSNVSPVKYEMGFYIAEDGILHSHRREALKSYIFVYSCPGVSQRYHLFNIQCRCRYAM
jgi:hypothetical protein